MISLKSTEGFCSKCKEWTDAKESCCGHPVMIEGVMVHPDIFNSDEYDEEWLSKTEQRLIDQSHNKNLIETT